MTFVAEKSDRYRLIDWDREIEMSHGPGAHGNHSSFFHEIGTPDALLGGGFRWTMSTKVLEGEEREKETDGKTRIERFFVSGPWKGPGEFIIAGYDRAEMREIIAEALLARQQLRNPELMASVRSEVVFWTGERFPR